MEDEEPTKEELLTKTPVDFKTDRLKFDGLRGDASLHLSAESLWEKISKLPAAARDVGTLDLIVARTEDFGREILPEADLTPDGRLLGDRWGAQTKYGPAYQLAVTRTDFAQVIANGQPLELHGDNLYVSLDLSAENLPPGTRLRIGGRVVEVTEQDHNGCKKWVQRFGLAPMRLNLAPHFRSQHLRGIYFKVVEGGLIRAGDKLQVLSRPQSEEVAQ